MTVKVTISTPASDYQCLNLSGYVLASGNAHITAEVASAPTIEGYTVQSVTTEGGVIKFKYSLTTNPFEAAKSTVASPTWYIMRLVCGYGNYMITWDGTCVRHNTLLNTYPISNDYLWCFEGNETDGYYIYNKGQSKYLGPSSSEEASSGNPYLDLFSSANTRWTLIYRYGYYELYSITGTKFVNRGSNRVHYWATPIDKGGITLDNALTLYQTNYPYSGINSHPDCIGSYTSANIDAAKTAVSNTEPTTVDNYATYVAALGSKISIVDGGYYYIQGNKTNSTLRTMTGYVSVSSKSGNDGIATEVWKITSAPSSKYYIQNVASGKYIGTIVSGGTTGSAMSEEPVAITIGNYGKDYIKTFCTTTGATNYIHESTGHTYGIVGWGESSDNSQWNICLADLSTIEMLSPDAVASADADVYMSYANNTGYDKQMPSDVTVYKVLTGGTTEEVNMVEVTSKVVPDGAGVVLMAKKGAEIPLLPTSTSESLTGNVLVPGNGSSVSGYLLAYDKSGDGTPKFYLMNDLVLANNKAYLPGTYFGSSVKALSLNFDNTTIVKSVDEEEPIITGEIYNLSGVRLKKLQKGVNLVNGKAIIVK